MTSAPLRRDLERIAIICPSWVGDTVMATPVFRAVREHCPGATITAVVRRGLGSLLGGAPWIDEVIEAPHKGRGAILSLARRLRGARLDAVLLLPNSFRSGIVASLSGAPIRVGYRRNGRGLLLTHGIPVTKTATPRSTVLYYAELAGRAIGADVTDLHLELATSSEDESGGATALPESEPFALLNPGGNKLEKRWPAVRFGEVADRLVQDHQLRPVVTGAPSERGIVSAVIGAMRPETRESAIDLVERGITLGALKSITSRAALMVTNDTGPRHIAAAFRTPVVSLFGPTDPRWTTLEGVPERIIRAAPFLPEEFVADARPKQCAIERITVGDVLDAANTLLATAAT